MRRNEYTVIQGENYKNMAIRVLEHMKVAEDIGDKKKSIGIKPNLAVAKTADSGATTHPEILDGLLTYLLENDLTNVTVMEGSWVGDSTAKAVKISGIYDVCRKHGIPFIDTKKESYREKMAVHMKINVFP